MTRTVAPYGTWDSPISADMLASAAVGLGEPWLEDGVAYWLELRPAEGGRQVLVCGDPHGAPRDLVPDGFNVRTMVHEYGGGAYAVHRGTAIVSGFPDQRLYRIDPGGAPIAITPDVGEGMWRFADGRITPDGRTWIGVRERHDLGPAVADVVNELVVLPLDGSADPRTIASGRDFYANPRISPDGTKLAFLAWDLPWMPWDGTELFVADLAPDGSLGDVHHVAGEAARESIWQPEWSPRGDLVFASDRSGWWNLEHISDGERRVLHAAEAEFGYPLWVFGDRSFAFLGDGRIACCYDRDGQTRFGVLDPASGELLDLDLPYDALRWGPCLVAEGSAIVLIAGSATLPNHVVWLDFDARSVEVLRESVSMSVDPAVVSEPRAITFPTEGGLFAHALFYPPTHPSFEAPEGERPPLIVTAHGGPTGNTTPIFDLGLQYWTTRGFAVVDVDYGGSTGYGRAYRQRLNGQWGVVDLQDCVHAARYLVGEGLVDGDRLLVRGGSAGGYVVMCALTFTDAFAAGASYYGIADLVPFATGDTHKFESRYEHTMVGPWPEAEAVYRERSPINFVERLSTPMLVLQGADDLVVPPAQAELIVAALRERHVPHAYLLFEGEGHGFRRAETIVAAREAELSFYGQIRRVRARGRHPDAADRGVRRSSVGDGPRRRGVWWVAGAAVLAVAVVALVVIRIGDGGEPAEAGAVTIARGPGPALFPGETIPTWSAPALDGSGAISSSDFLGGPVVLAVWAPWSDASRAELPRLVDAMRTHPDIELVTITTAVEQEPSEGSAAVLDAAGLSFPVAVDDATLRLHDGLGVSGLPSVYFVTAQGVVVDHVEGEIGLRGDGSIDPTVLENLLVALEDASPQD